MSEVLNVNAIHSDGEAKLIVGIRGKQFQFELDKGSGAVVLSDPNTGRQLSLFANTASDVIEHEDYPGCYYRIVDGEMEWENPPLVTNVEYRTTERYQGAIVYKKVDSNGDVLWRVGNESSWHLLTSSDYISTATVE